MDDSKASKLVESASGGDQRAAEQLLVHYWPDLEQFLARRAGGVRGAVESGADLAQSVCREVLADLADQKLRFRGEPEFRQWLYQAADLKLKEKRRYWGRKKRAAAREVAPPASGSDARERFFISLCTPSAAAQQREELERLHRAFDALPADQRRLIELAHFQQRPHAEIAALLGITETNSRVMLTRALARLSTLAAKR
ncbi:MAG TPA: sigma-70 family RNA polymerase sigma factor [Planctomycetota bacterium]|nr:sigma-70 family RNA polymerase sigma factor [Planctomycetota bacterium]